MSEYIFPVFIFITSLFIACILIKPSEKLLAFVCMIGALFITYVSLNIAKSAPETSAIILGVIFLILLIILIALIFSNKDKTNLKITSIFYAVVIVIAFFSARGCYNDDQINKEGQIAKDNTINEFKKLYDFNVDSLLTNANSSEKIPKNYKITFPTIVYRKWDGKTDFDYNFNKSLEQSWKSFSLDSINSIVVIENSTIDIGTYSNGKTKAQKIQTTLSFLDRRTLKQIANRILVGGEPPSSIEYRRSSPESSSGSAPSENEIISAMKEELQFINNRE